jgi:hypothetical protein
MSDYNPNNFDKYGNPTPSANNGLYEPADDTGRAPYVLLGLLALIAVVGGALYFNGGANKGGSNVAAAPPAIERTAPADRVTPAIPPRGPLATTPAPTATPAPAGAPAMDK